MEKEYYMQDLMLQKYNRFFSFGCSFTQYHWPTWANVIGMHFDYDNFYNMVDVVLEIILLLIQF